MPNSMSVILEMVGEVLALTLDISAIVNEANDIDPADKEALKAKIKEAQTKVTYWNDDEEDTN